MLNDFECSGVVLAVLVGFYIGRVPSHWFLAGGALLTGLSNVLYAVRKLSSSYWAYEFPAQLLSYGILGLCESTLFA